MSTDWSSVVARRLPPRPLESRDGGGRSSVRAARRSCRAIRQLPTSRVPACICHVAAVWRSECRITSSPRPASSRIPWLVGRRASICWKACDRSLRCHEISSRPRSLSALCSKAKGFSVTRIANQLNPTNNEMFGIPSSRHLQPASYTQPGGPAAINGFLYQIIQHLVWLADVTLHRALRSRLDML
ncbi:MAG: hypothetical protein JWP08_3045 [Bryobacterales bacterium]|nr:hypothetical protein [Bryobacterales bacterium]